MGRCVPHQLPPFMGAARGAGKHAAEGLVHIARAAIGQARDDSACRKDLRIGRQHHIGHGAACGKAGDEDAVAVDVEIHRHAFDHVADRARLPLVARDMGWIEPAETGVGVVGAFLLGIEQGEAMGVGQRRPAGAMVIGLRGLGAAMQHHDKARFGAELLRRMDEHPQIAGIGAELLDLHQPPIPLVRRRTAGYVPQGPGDFSIVGEFGDDFAQTRHSGPFGSRHHRPVPAMLQCSMSSSPFCLRRCRSAGRRVHGPSCARHGTPTPRGPPH